MVSLIATEVFRAVVQGTILAILFGVIGTWVWSARRLRRGEPILPPTPLVERRSPPWGAGTILLILAVFILVSRDAFERYARATGAIRVGGRAEAPVPVGKDAPGKAGPTPSDANPKAGPIPPGPRKDDHEATPYGLSPLELMSIQGAINGLFIVLMPALAWLTVRARPRDLGLTARGWRRQVAVGIIAVLFLMPIIYSIQLACVLLLDLPDSEREKFRHPLEKMLGDHFSPGVASLAFLTAVILAPVFEEVLFRGFLQTWLVRVFTRLGERLHTSLTAYRSNVATVPEILPDKPSTEDPLNLWDLTDFPVIEAAESGYWQAADEDGAAPTGKAPGSLVPKTSDPPSPSHSRRWTGAAIGLTSLVFAALHAPQWPAPISLFVFALGLGIVYQRTGSLLAPICMHAVFNGFSTLMLFLVALQGTDQPKPKARPVLEHVAPAEKHGRGGPAIAPMRPGTKTGIHAGFFWTKAGPTDRFLDVV